MKVFASGGGKWLSKDLRLKKPDVSEQPVEAEKHLNSTPVKTWRVGSWRLVHSHLEQLTYSPEGGKVKGRAIGEGPRLGRIQEVSFWGL